MHEPWKLPRAEQERVGCRIGNYGAPDTDYPNPPKTFFSYGDSSGGKGGKGGRGGGGRNVPLTPGQAAVMARGGGGGGKGRGRGGRAGGGRKRVQHGAFAMEDE